MLHSIQQRIDAMRAALAREGPYVVGSISDKHATTNNRLHIRVKSAGALLYKYCLKGTTSREIDCQEVRMHGVNNGVDVTLGERARGLERQHSRFFRPRLLPHRMMFSFSPGSIDNKPRTPIERKR